VSSDKVRSAITIDKSLWDKYNLDEYGEDQDEIEESNEKPVYIYYSSFFLSLVILIIEILFIC
jgi:hypothetical protein